VLVLEARPVGIRFKDDFSSGAYGVDDFTIHNLLNSGLCGEFVLVGRLFYYGFGRLLGDGHLWLLDAFGKFSYADSHLIIIRILLYSYGKTCKFIQ
jgi:hypothetical protein